MSDSVMTVLAIFLAAVLMFIFPLMSTADRSDDISQQAIQTATTDFVDDIRTTARITKDKYEAFNQTIAATGNSFEIEMQVEVLDENSNKKTTQASPVKVGENYSYTEYTSQILEKIERDGVYKLKEGDIISVAVRNTNQTISQILKNFMYRVTGNGNYVITARHSGIVNVNGN